MRDIPADSAETDAAFRRTITTLLDLLAFLIISGQPDGWPSRIFNVHAPHCLRFPAETCREIKFNNLNDVRVCGRTWLFIKRVALYEQTHVSRLSPHIYSLPEQRILGKFISLLSFWLRSRLRDIVLIWVIDDRWTDRRTGAKVARDPSTAGKTSVTSAGKMEMEIVISMLGNAKLLGNHGERLSAENEIASDFTDEDTWEREVREWEQALALRGAGSTPPAKAKRRGDAGSLCLMRCARDNHIYAKLVSPAKLRRPAAAIS